MTVRKLTPNEIQGLFIFCRKQKVRYYDVQVELVDHLATTIEDLWKTYPGLSFQDALTKVYIAFGANGFQKIEQAKKKELKKKYNRIFWKYLIEFFRLPKIIVTAAIILVLFFIFRSSGDLIMLNVAFLALSFLCLITCFAIIYKRKIKVELIEKRLFLLLDYSNSMTISMVLSTFLPFNVIIIATSFSTVLGQKMQQSNLFFLVLACFYVLAFLFSWVSWIYVPQRIKEDFTREYPQFVKA